MIYFQQGSPDAVLTEDDLRAGVAKALESFSDRRKVIAVPPDVTRSASRAGVLTRLAYEELGDRFQAVLPALGTHVPMSDEEIEHMYAGVPKSLFKVHNWREDVITLGETPSSFVREVSEGKLDWSWPAQVNRRLVEDGYDLILSVGQVVPHEVVGMANHNKNIFVGTGGPEGINKSHFLGAVYGMERIMGRAESPVRALYDYASDHFSDQLPTILYLLTVVGRQEDGSLCVRGLFIGDDKACFLEAAALSQKVNLQLLDKPLQRVVVYLDPHEFRTTWLGNKSVYRTRMAIADDGDLIVLAPGLREFGEDKEIDRLIRKYGYKGTPATLDATNRNPELQQNLSAAAHLIHGSSEGRFRITYCPGALTREEVESVGFQYGDLQKFSSRYDPARLKDGWNNVDGEDIFYISNPALGLWAAKEKFNKS